MHLSTALSFNVGYHLGHNINILKDTIIEKNPVDKVRKIKFVTSIYVLHNNFQRSQENFNGKFNFSGTYQMKALHDK